MKITAKLRRQIFAEFMAGESIICLSRRLVRVGDLYAPDIDWTGPGKIAAIEDAIRRECVLRDKRKAEKERKS